MRAIVSEVPFMYGIVAVVSVEELGLLSFCPGVNVIKVLHLYFTRVAIVFLAENNSCTCKLQV